MKESIVFLGAHPDDLASEMGTALLFARASFDVHVVDYTHGERGCGEEKTRLIGLYACQSGPAIAERKKNAQVYFGMADGRMPSCMEPYALMAGTATPTRCVFAALEEASF